MNMNRPLTRHFVSYPKSGRTWVRYALTQLKVESSIHFHHDGFEFNDGKKPSHSFDLESRLEKYINVNKLVYLERDPRDVMVSLYFQVTGRFKDFFEYQGSISDFIRDDYFGAHNLMCFRSLWKEMAAHRDVLVISYEACHQDLRAILIKLLEYYELEVNLSILDDVITQAAFTRMKQLEQSASFHAPWLRPRQGSPKVRRGIVGGFHDELNKEDIRYLNEIFGVANDSAGFLIDRI